MYAIKQAIKHPIIAFKLYAIDKVKPYPGNELVYLIETFYDA